MKKRLKLPNGFGSITRKADGRRRKPYVVRKTIGSKQIHAHLSLYTYLKQT